MNYFYYFLTVFVLLHTFTRIHASDDGFKREKTHLKKDPRDYTDRDVDSLFEEWEVSRSLLYNDQTKFLRSSLQRITMKMFCPMMNDMIISFESLVQ